MPTRFCDSEWGSTRKTAWNLDLITTFYTKYAYSPETPVEWGDANPRNTNEKIVHHILRMAATRAKARALRDFTNIGMTCLEELGDFDEVIGPEKNDLVGFKKTGNTRTPANQSRKTVETEPPVKIVPPKQEEKTTS